MTNTGIALFRRILWYRCRTINRA